MKIFLALCFTLLSSICYSFSIDDLKTSSDVKKALEYFHIESTQLNWAEIDRHCRLTTHNDIEFNRCKLKEAKQEGSFIKNSSSCNNQAISDFPDSMIGRNFEDNSQNIGNNNIIYKYTIDDLNRDRKRIYRNCMKELHWVDPYDYKQGKSQ